MAERGQGSYVFEETEQDEAGDEAALQDVRLGADQCVTAAAEASVLCMDGSPAADEIEQWLGEAEGALAFARDAFDAWVAGAAIVGPGRM